MAYKYREEIVGKRFLSVSAHGKLKLNKISDWEWRSGIVRATSHKDPKHPELTVLVEFDDTDWKSREWIRLYQDGVFHLFVVENTLVWTLRKETALTGVTAKSNLYWPSLTFIPLVDKVGLSDNRLQPVEYLVDKELWFVDYADVLQYQEQDVDCPPANRDFAEVQKAIRQWTEYQDGQRILVTTPSVLVGYRVEVYRVEGTTQWYTAVIVSYNDSTRELTLTDDTVLEEHNEDPCLVQMKLIGDGVVESILKGENIGITPRRRACSSQQAAPVHYSTRNRTHHPTSTSSSISSPYLSSTRILAPSVSSRKTRSRPAASSAATEDIDSGAPSSAPANSVPEKVSSGASHHQSQQEHTSRVGDRRKKGASESGDVAVSNNHRKHQAGGESRKKNSRQKRASVNKDVEDTDSAEDEECNSQRSKTSNNLVGLAQQSKDESVTETTANGSSETSVLPEGSGETSSKGQSSVKSVKEHSGKVESKDSCSETLISDQRDTAVSIVERTSSASSHNSNTPSVSNSIDSSEGDRAPNQNNSNPGSSASKHLTRLSPTVSSVSVVLTPLSPSVVSAVVNPKSASDRDTPPPAAEGRKSTESIEPSDENVSSPVPVAESEDQPKSKETEAVPEVDRAAAEDKGSSLLEGGDNLCPKDKLGSGDETVEDTYPQQNRDIDNSPQHSDIKDTKETPDTSCLVKEKTSPKAKVYQPSVKEPSSGTQSKPHTDSDREKVTQNGGVTIKNSPPRNNTRVAHEKAHVFPVDPHSVIRSQPEYSALNLSDTKSSSRNIIVNSPYQRYNSCNDSSAHLGVSFDEINAIFRAESRRGSFPPNSHVPGMSHIDKAERSASEKSNSSSHQSINALPSGNSGSRHQQIPVSDRRTSSPRESNSSKERNRSEEKKHATNLHVDRHESVRVYRDPHLVNSGQGVRHVDCLHHGLMHPAGLSHSAAAAAAAGVYPRVAALPQHSRTPGAPIPPTTLGPYSLPSHLLPPPHIANTGGAGGPPPQPPPPPPPSASHIDQQQHTAAMHSQAYRHLLSQHPLLPPQYGGSAPPHVGLDLMWQQKYNPNPWVMYEELRLERERAIAQERERSRIERDCREDMERLDREKAEREKAEKERLERERMQKEQQRHDRERLDREERERAQREAVQQHFEESLRLALQKQQQLQQKSMGWSPMSSLPLGKTQPGIGRSSPTVSLPQGAHNQSFHSSEHDRDKVREKDKERHSAMEARIRQEHERWLVAVQQRNEQPAAHSSHPQNYSAVEGRGGSAQAKEMYSMPRTSPHASASAGHLSKSGISPSSATNAPTSSNVPSSQHKSETNFSLYGYQPFQHTYITHAQLKAREETKGPNNMQPIIISGSKQQNPGSSVKQEKDVPYDRPTTPGNGRTGTPIGQGSGTKQQMKVMHQGQERSSPMYQPLVGSGGAFKPYEYANSSPAPPAHQNSSSPTMAARIGTPQFHHSQQDQPQNLVKGDHKASHDLPAMPAHNHQRYDIRDMRQTVSTPPCSVPASYTPPYSMSKSVSPASSANYSYSLIQQGLVPNPLYIAATHSSASTTSASVSSQAPSKSSPHAGSPPISQQFPRGVPGSGITSGTPVCRSSSVPYPSQQARSSRSYSPVGHLAGQNMSVNPNRTCPQEAHGGNRGIPMQGSAHRSPSPAHMYGSPASGIQSGTSGSPHHSRGPTCSPRINTVPNASQIQNMHRMVMQPMPNAVPLSPPLCGSSDSQVVPLNLQGSNSVAKRKSKDMNCKKRQKTEEHLLPPQLHPQIHPASNSPACQVGTPPHLLLNAAHISSQGTILPSPTIPENPSGQVLPRPESVAAPSSSLMPDLHGSGNVTSLTNMNSTPGLVESYHALAPHTSENSVIGGKHGKPQSKCILDSPNSDAVDLPVRPSSSASSTASNVQFAPSVNTGGHDGGDESRMTVSPASSASSTVTSGSGTGASTNHTKLKKAWLQRHSENEDKKIPPDTLKVDSPIKPQVETTDESKSNIPLVPSKSLPDVQDTKSNASDGSSVNGQECKPPKVEVQLEDDSTSSASEIEEVKHVKRKLRIGRNKQGSTNSKKQKLTVASNESPVEETNQFKKDSNRKKSAPAEKEAVNCKRRGRKNKGRNTPSEEAAKKKAVKPPEKPSIAQLKKTGEPFLQDGPCCEVAPRLPKCRECRMTPHQRSKKINIFCRFYAYRKLRYGKNGTILGAGFSEPSDATDEDMKLWLPPVDSPPSDVEIETSKFLLTHVGDQFCDLVEMEREAQALHSSETAPVTWKRVVQGVREMCDVCETTLFNIHWVCHKCGFVVCIDCYKARKNGLGKGEESLSKDRDQYQWLLCTNRQAHEHEKLMLTQIIANTALWDVGKTLHEIRRRWNIPTYCNCSNKDGEEGKHATNGICKLMSAVTKCFSSDKEPSQVNGLTESSRLNKKNSKNSSVNGVVKQEDGVSGYSSESGGSPLSWLADVALNSSSKVKDEKKGKSENGEEDKFSDSQQDNTDGFAESDDEKSENFSTLRELLIRPMGKMGSKNSGTDSSSQKTLTSTLDEVISCVIEQRVRKSDKKCKEKQLLHFTRRRPLLRSGRELLPIRSCMLTESSLLYPEIPHVWLGNGRILLLTDPTHSGNMQMFQEQWKRGQPVIVASVGQKLDESLWNPENFIRDFGEIKSDFLNCVCGTLLQNQPLKKFWEGFENKSKRMKDEDGETMVLKLKDWPPSEEFSELLPTRYQDLMKVLPLPQYTHRNGVFNMASRLPDCFAKPDLGPRMYNAYGLSSSHTKASTNLHLDVSDAVNILAYVGNNSDESDNSESDIMKALDESGCDSSMRKRGIEQGSNIGAIWHVYNARDADKIRDLLNKVAEEQGAKCDPHHDPIHNREWYLDGELRERLYKEYGVECYVIAQCFGDAIFIPAGSPHQVKNLNSCIKVSEDFVSPESVGHSFFLTQEIRNLSDSPFNQEDKLQIKNIIYHAVKDALALLQSNNPEDAKS